MPIEVAPQPEQHPEPPRLTFPVREDASDREGHHCLVEIDKVNDEYSLEIRYRGGSTKHVALNRVNEPPLASLILVDAALRQNLNHNLGKDRAPIFRNVVEKVLERIQPYL